VLKRSGVEVIPDQLEVGMPDEDSKTYVSADGNWDVCIVHEDAVVVYQGNKEPVHIHAHYYGVPDDVMPAVLGAISKLRTKIHLPGE
jgi:hypothetical protein